MIEAGLDGLHAVQPCCRGMDLARLKADYGGQIVFNGAIDSHHVLINGTPETSARDPRGARDHEARRRLRRRRQQAVHVELLQQLQLLHRRDTLQDHRCISSTPAR